MLFNTNKEKSLTGLSVAIAYFGSNGYIVSLPLTDQQDYDLIVDKDNLLQKVQVKCTNHIVNNGSYSCNLETTSGTSRKVVKTVVETDVDLLFVLCGAQTMYLIPVKEIDNKRSINLRKERSKFANKSTKDYSVYEVIL